MTPSARTRFAATLPLKAALVGLLLSAGAVQAQYQWRDANGQLIVSDQPPPASVKPSQIIKAVPMPAPAPAVPPASNAKTPQAKPAGPQSAADKDLAFRKRQQEKAEAEKSSAEKQAAAAQKAKYCEQLGERLQTLESGIRIQQVNKNGEAAAMEGGQREQATSEARRDYRTNCRS